MWVTIDRAAELPRETPELAVEAAAGGFRHVRRLIDDWTDGGNRFDGAHEALFVARGGRIVVGIAGLNADPYAAPGARAGRVRRMYVSAAARRKGVGRQLLAAVVRQASGVFDELRLRTDDSGADGFYRRMGFAMCRSDGLPETTHRMILTPPLDC